MQYLFPCQNIHLIKVECNFINVLAQKTVDGPSGKGWRDGRGAAQVVKVYSRLNNQGHSHMASSS